MAAVAVLAGPGALPWLAGSASAAVAAVPAPPQGLRVDGVAEGSIQIRWVDSSGSEPVLGYSITSDEGGSQFVTEACDEGGPMEALFTGLDPDRPHTFTLRTQTASGVSAPVTTAPVYARPEVGNVVLNPSFESGLQRWGGVNATLSRTSAAGATSGAFAARVTRTRGTSTSYTLGDAVVAGDLPTIPRTVAGQRHVAVASVKAANKGTVGKPISVLLRERTPSGAPVRTTRGTVKQLTNGWQEVWVDAAVTRAGNTLGLAVEQTAAVQGNAFLVDNVRLYSTGGFIMGSESRTATNVVGTNVKRAISTSTGEWSPNGPDGCYSEYPHEYAMTSLKVYLDGKAATSGSQPIRGVLYDAQGRLKATTQTVTVTAGQAAGWVTLPFATPVAGHAEGGVDYLLGVHTGGTSRVVRVFGASGEGGSLYNTDAFADGPASTFGAASTGTLSTAVYAYGGM